MPAAHADAVVIGAGVIGCSVAVELARTGRHVLVVDKGPAAGAGSTSSSSAVIRFSYSTLDGVLTAWESHFAWREWAAHLGGVVNEPLARFHRVGMLTLDAPGIDTAKILGLFDAVGVPYERWDAAAVREHVPALDPSRFGPPRLPADDAFWAPPTGELGGFFTPDAGFVDDPQLAARNLMAAAQAAGAQFRFGRAVTAVDRSGDAVRGVVIEGDRVDAPVVVNAAGPYSRRVNEMARVLGDFSVSTRPLRQEVHVLDAPPTFTVEGRGTVVADGDLGTYFRPHPGGTVMVGGVEAACDPLVWVDDPDACGDEPTVDLWKAQTLRVARRLPEASLPSRPRGLAALYDVSDDWIPIYDRTSLDGFFVAIGTSGNQFKNAPLAGRFLAALVEAAASGHDHDAEPVCVRGEHSGRTINLGHYSRRRERHAASSNSVWG